ncbi:MAG: Re/Si-specific NAD(P)(+) transhydrogenase subunit alpha [Halobacteriovoraceae bacterium]|nr:Re/Si-specific NAD(P)(+) transhydrogenase subunit alpha [Halobacteriovoraceae bacterium]
MYIAVAKESNPEETRVALLPSSVEKLSALRINVLVEEGLGKGLHHSDEDYRKAGAEVVSREELFSKANMVLQVSAPIHDNFKIKDNSSYLGFLDPFNHRELLQRFARQRIDAFSMEMLPRITRAQKMDVLSSQASLAGYQAVILAAKRLDRVFPMMTTPAGTLFPAKIFVIGAGVAGLQAIATAKRLGARVEAFDTRTVVEEQIRSLGAKFIKINLGETGQTQNGYARELTSEQLEKQRQTMGKHCASSDVVITTAQIFGKKAPVIVTQDMVQKMRPGSIIIDLAASTGGNVEGSHAGEEVNINGVTILGPVEPARQIPLHASQMYSSNVVNFIMEFWNQEKKKINLNLQDDIIKNCLITHKGEIIHQRFK